MISRPLRLLMLQLATILGFLSMAYAPAAMAQDISGTYSGIDGAQGIAVRLSRGGSGYQGEISAATGRQAQLDLQATTAGARGPLVLQGQNGTVEFLEKPLGLSMVWRPDFGGQELVYAFRHERLALPTPPAGYKDPPPHGATRVNPMDFLNSYEFWEAAQVGRAYDGMDDKYRVIIKSFATVHTDILWKLCRAPTAPVQLVDALRGQGVTCAEVQSRIRAAQSTGGFSRFKQAVQAQKYDALKAVECARGINTADICTRAAQRTQQAVLSLETAGSILSRY